MIKYFVLALSIFGILTACSEQNSPPEKKTSPVKENASHPSSNITNSAYPFRISGEGESMGPYIKYETTPAHVPMSIFVLVVFNVSGEVKDDAVPMYYQSDTPEKIDNTSGIIDISLIFPRLLVI